MSVMSISTTAWRSLSIVTLASASRRKLPRIAAATPMPTSQLPSRTWPGRALRLSQPKRWAPSLQAGAPGRVSRTAPSFPDPPRARSSACSSMGSMSRRTASSSIACSTASKPDRLAGRAHRSRPPAGRARRCAGWSCGWARHRATASKRRCGSANSSARALCASDRWAIAVSVPSRSAPRRTRWIEAGRWVVTWNICWRVRATLAPAG